jgi:hypothetical protein
MEQPVHHFRSIIPTPFKQVGEMQGNSKRKKTHRNNAGTKTDVIKKNYSLITVLPCC